MRIRVGKNIFFKLTVNRLNDEPEDFTDARNVKLTINRKYSSYQVSPPLTIRDNIIEFEFIGGGNATSGQYEVHLYYEKLNEASVTGIDKFYLDFCNAFILVDLTCKEDTGFESESPSINLKGIIERNRDGKDGVTPRIDPETKHWMIGIEDTGIVAEGKDGLTPSIGENGNWWIGDVDTGKPSRGKAFEYSDFTPEEIKELQKPASDMINALDTLDKAVTANEQQRINNENTRVSSENTRKESESLRRETENTRASNEEARKNAETGRASAEDNRVKAEQSRVESESNRVKAETLRVEKENERQTAENTRDTNEQSRKEAETNRVTAEEGRVTEFNRLKSESETATSNATTQADYAKQQGDNVAGTVNEIKTAQSSLLTRVNDYMYDMSGLLGKLVYKGMFHSLLDRFTLNGYYNENGEFIAVIEGNVISTPKMNIISDVIYHLIALATANNVYVLNLYDENDKLIYNSINNQHQVEKDYIFVGASKISLSIRKSEAQISPVGYYDLQDPSIEGNRALYVAAGAVYNQNTGFYELNGLTDITEEQMREIYTVCGGNPVINNLIERYYASSIRTNIPFRVSIGTNNNPVLISSFLANCGRLEVFQTSLNNGTLTLGRCTSLFYNCRSLIRVNGVIDVYNSGSYTQMFFGCMKLESINVRRIKIDISFSDSPLISLESLQYLITNAANTSPITVTVHADVYAKIQDEGQVDWHALIETAAAKQITFATA